MLTRDHYEAVCQALEAGPDPDPQTTITEEATA